MTSLQKGLLCLRWQPSLQFVRFRKVNVQKPFPPHFTRAKVEALCKPYFEPSKYTDPSVPLDEICSVGTKYFKKLDIVNPYVTLMGKEVLNYMNHSKIIAFFHLNPMSTDDFYDVRLALKKLQMKVRTHGKEIMTSAVRGTKYETVLTFYNSSTMMAFGPEPDVKGLMRTLKKQRGIILLAAVVEDRLLSRAEIEYYASIPDLQSAQASLVATLNSAAQSVVRHLNQHQTTLVQHLQSHVDINSKKESS